MTTTLTLASLPPSANVIWRTGPRGTYRNPKYVAWLQEEGLLLKSQMRGQTKFTDLVQATVRLRQNRANSDLDNRLKALGDLIASVNAISNDKLIHHWDLRWSKLLNTGVAGKIIIEPLADEVAA